MKRFSALSVLVVAAVAAVVLAVPAMAAPARKRRAGSATRSTRTSSGTVVQRDPEQERHLLDVLERRGRHAVRRSGSPMIRRDYTHHVTLTQNGQTVGGSGGYPLRAAPYHWDVTTGSVRRQRAEPDPGLRRGAPGVIHTSTEHRTRRRDHGHVGGQLRSAPRTGTFTAPAGCYRHHHVLRQGQRLLQGRGRQLVLRQRQGCERASATTRGSLAP